MKTLQEVLEENDIQTFESSNGRRVAKCPFHEGDRNPSFTIYPNETYYCFGCRVWGNPVKFLVEYKGMPAAEAMAYVGVDYTIPRSEKKVIKVQNIFETAKFLFDIASRYADHLWETEGALKYLRDRGLSNAIIQKHMIGYTDGTTLHFDYAWEHKLAEEIGLMNKAGFEAMAHRIVIPNIIDREYCDFMIGRTVINDKIKYLGLRMPKPIMGFHQYRHAPILFMVEGQFDWLLLKQWGYPSVVMSGSHITKANVELLRGKFVVYIPDADDTGRDAARAIVDKLGPANTAIIDISEYGFKDISEWTQYDSNSETRFGQMILESLKDILLSNPTWSKYLPIWISAVPSLST